MDLNNSPSIGLNPLNCRHCEKQARVLLPKERETGLRSLFSKADESNKLLCVPWGWRETKKHLFKTFLSWEVAYKFSSLHPLPL